MPSAYRFQQADAAIQSGDFTTLSHGRGHGDHITGTDGDDSLVGSSGGDRIEGLGGNDTIDGGTGSDRIDAGSGDDAVTSLHADETGRSNVSIDLGDGDDTLDFSGNDQTSLRLSDGAGDDLMQIDGGGRVTINDGAGADTIELLDGAGRLRINLGADSDTIKLDANATFANGLRVDGFAAGDGGDKLDLSGFLSTALSNWDGVTDPFSDGHLQLVQNGDGAMLQIDADGGGDSFVDLVQLKHVDGSDLTSFNFSGLDPMFTDFSGGDGDDHAHGGGGDDDMSGNGGDDVLHGGGGDDSVAGGDGQDSCSGNGGNDLLTGGAGGDTLAGAGGHDTLEGGAGGDQLSGGGGGDVFLFGQDAADGSTDTVSDFDSSHDLIDLSSIDADPLSDGDQAFAFVDAFTSQAGQATLSYDSGADQTTAAFDVDGDGVADLTLVMNGHVTADEGWVL
jgi:Ca2+-binding RTX toxin-like protein